MPSSGDRPDPDGARSLCLLYWQDVFFITSGPWEAHTTTSPGFRCSHTKPGIMRVWRPRRWDPWGLAATVPSPKAYPTTGEHNKWGWRAVPPPTRGIPSLHSLNAKLNFSPCQEAFLTRGIPNHLLPMNSDSICSCLSAWTISYHSISISQKPV